MKLQRRPSPTKREQEGYWLKELRRKEADNREQKTQTAPFVEVQDVCQIQKLRPDRTAAIVRKGDISIEITESASAGFIAKVMEALADA